MQKGINFLMILAQKAVMYAQTVMLMLSCKSFQNPSCTDFMEVKSVMDVSYAEQWLICSWFATSSTITLLLLRSVCIFIHCSLQSPMWIGILIVHQLHVFWSHWNMSIHSYMLCYGKTLPPNSAASGTFSLWKPNRCMLLFIFAWCEWSDHVDDASGIRQWSRSNASLQQGDSMLVVVCTFSSGDNHEKLTLFRYFTTYSHLCLASCNWGIHPEKQLYNVNPVLCNDNEK